MNNETVAFYMPELASPDELDDVDPDRDWHVLGAGRYQTVAQTYLRLREAGMPVRMATNPPPAGTTVVFAPNLKRFLKECPRRADVTVVCVEADRPVAQLPLADVIVRHNGLGADGRRVCFIPNWPQGGLVPRDPSRGTEVRTIAYKGRAENLHPAFTSPAWHEFLEAKGMQYILDLEGELRSNHTYAAGAMGWNDYSNVDLLLAVRPGLSDPNGRKPALKLVNTWMAGVPGLLGPEYAYRELRRSDLDYIEVDSLESAREAVTRLSRDRERYAAMVANGRSRSEDFTVEAITRRWQGLLFGQLDGSPPRRLAVYTRPLLWPVRRAQGRARRFVRVWRDEYRKGPQQRAS